MGWVSGQTLSARKRHTACDLNHQSLLEAEVRAKEALPAEQMPKLLASELAQNLHGISSITLLAVIVTENRQRAFRTSVISDRLNGLHTSAEKAETAISGKFDTVCCVDVLIHYPPDKMSGMVQHLAGLSKERLILSFAPKTWYYTLLKRIGELFPGKSKTTRNLDCLAYGYTSR
eukprot:Skav224429  [mRNA]  locus=scaffold657:632425:634321:- [translate_table: standard]